MISKNPIIETGNGATEAQKDPMIIANKEKRKDSVLNLKYHKIKEIGPDKIVIKKITATINAKDAICYVLKK